MAKDDWRSSNDMDEYAAKWRESHSEGKLPPGVLPRMWISYGVRNAPAAAVSSATLSSTNKNANVTISGAGLIATDGGAGGVSHAGRGTTATTVITSGTKIYLEAVATTIAAGTNGIGVCNVSKAFTDNAYLGDDANAICWFSDGSVYSSGAQVATWAAYAAGNRVCLAIIGAGKIWGRVAAGNWNNDVIGNQNPATNTGGTSIAAMGDVYAAYNLQGANVWTFNFGSTFTHTAPDGFSAYP